MLEVKQIPSINSFLIVVVSPGSSLGYSSYPEVHGHLNHNYSDRINMSLHEPSSIDEGIEIDNERSGYIKHLKVSC